MIKIGEELLFDRKYRRPKTNTAGKRATRQAKEHDFEKLLSLFTEMNSLGHRISEITNRPATIEYTGEYIVSRVFDFEQQAVLYKGRTTPSAQGGLGFLFEFLNNPRQVLSFQDIILQKENVKLTEDRARTRGRAMIRRLHSRLVDIPGGDQWIESVRGRGYIFNV